MTIAGRVFLLAIVVYSATLVTFGAFAGKYLMVPMFIEDFGKIRAATLLVGVSCHAVLFDLGPDRHDRTFSGMAAKLRRAGVRAAPGRSD